jgi:hypothetical protein
VESSSKCDGARAPQYSIRRLDAWFAYNVLILSWESKGGLASGQQAIEKWFALQFASSPGEVGGKLVQVYPVGDEISAISEWSWGQWKGRQAMIYVRDADTWKIRMEYLVN